MSENTLTCVTVDSAASNGNIEPIWASIGYDELNWTYTPRGQALHRMLGSDVFAHSAYYTRNHNAFTSGSGLSAPAWGCGDVVTRTESGTLTFRWDIIDRVYDTITAHGGIPFIELGFMPRDLSRVDSHLVGFDPGADVGDEPYEAGAWKHPPRSLDEWATLVQAFIAHLVERYGSDRVRDWRFEIWNEPDLPNYWRGTVAEFLALWDATYTAAKTVFPSIALGGPATTAHGGDFLEQFCAHVTANGHLPDFLSFHTKGAYYFPRRDYRRSDVLSPVESVDYPATHRMLSDIEHNLTVIDRFPELRTLPVYVNECDPAVGTIYGVADNPNFVVANSEYYGSFVAHLVTHLIDNPRITRITHWAFYMEGKRWFEGNRTLVDNNNVPKPITFVLRLLDQLTGLRRIATQSDNPTVRTLAGSDGDCVRILVVHHTDNWQDDEPAQVHLELDCIGATAATIAIVDQYASNSFQLWRSLGADEWPTDDTVARLERVALHDEPLPLSQSNGRVSAEFTLSAHGVALVEVRCDTETVAQ